MGIQRLGCMLRTAVIQHPLALCALLLAAATLALIERGLLDPIALMDVAWLGLWTLILDSHARQRRQQRVLEQQLVRLSRLLATLSHDTAPPEPAPGRLVRFGSVEWRVIAPQSEVTGD
jgi:hypothetical protein